MKSFIMLSPTLSKNESRKTIHNIQNNNLRTVAMLSSFKSHEDTKSQNWSKSILITDSGKNVPEVYIYF